MAAAKTRVRLRAAKLSRPNGYVFSRSLTN
jgi:hypothetical protein